MIAVALRSVTGAIICSHAQHLFTVGLWPSVPFEDYVVLGGSGGLSN